MHVGTAFRYDGLSAAIRTTDARLQEAQRRVTTGKRIEKPSDDASGTRELIGISGLRRGIAAYTRNLDVANGALASAEAAYDGLGDLAQTAKTLAIQGATSALDPAARETLAATVATLQERLVSLGNSQAPDGRYLFGGRATDRPPFVRTEEGLAYNGDDVRPTAETGPGENAVVGETGGAIATLFDRLASLSKSLRSGDVPSLSKDRLAEVDDSLDAILAARGDVGRRMDGLERTRATHARRDEEFANRASDVGDVDYASAIVDYTAAQSAYQAALQVAQRGFSNGLMDFIR